MISSKLKAAIKLHSIPAYKIAWEAGIHPNTLSKLLCGIERPKPNDPRVVAIGRVLALTEQECFESSTADSFRDLGNSEMKQSK
jgi:hypothetical protein